MNTIDLNTIQPASISQTNTVGKKTPMPVNGSFDEYLMDAVSYVNDKQIASSDMAEKLITDPDSVDVHDVTIAMAEANLSLSLAQNVIDRLTKSWETISQGR